MSAPSSRGSSSACRGWVREVRPAPPVRRPCRLAARLEDLDGELEAPLQQGRACRPPRLHPVSDTAREARAPLLEALAVGRTRLGDFTEPLRVAGEALHADAPNFGGGHELVDEAAEHAPRERHLGLGPVVGPRRRVERVQQQHGLLPQIDIHAPLAQCAFHAARPRAWNVLASRTRAFLELSCAALLNARTRARRPPPSHSHAMSTSSRVLPEPAPASTSAWPSAAPHELEDCLRLVRRPSPRLQQCSAPRSCTRTIAHLAGRASSIPHG